MKLKEKILLSIALLSFIASTIFLIFYDQWQIQDENSTQQKIGTLSKKYNQVKRKTLHSLIWDDLNAEMALFAGDKIFTQAESGASLKIGKESLIEMSSLTLLNFEKSSKKDLNIQLEDGIIVASLTQTDLIQSFHLGNESINLKSPQSILELGSFEGDRSVRVIKGSANLKLNGKNIDLSPNELLLLNKAGEARKNKLKFSPLFPLATSSILSNEIGPLKFQWETLVKKSEQKIIEVSRLTNFSKLVASTSTFKDEILLNLAEEKTGDFFWRIYYADEKPTEAPFFKFTVHQFLPPKLFFPAKEQRIILPKDKTMAEFDFEWEESEDARFKLELGKFDGQARQIIQTVITSEDKIASQPLPPGKYWWRVEKKLAQLPATWSELRTFDVYDSKILFAVDYVAPQDKSQMTNPTVTFTWDSRPENEYQLIVSDETDFKTNLLSQKVSNLTHQTTFHQTGTFYWKLAHVAGLEEAKTWSFQISAPKAILKSPQDKEKIVIFKALEPIKFKWENNYPSFVSTENQIFHLKISQGDNQIISEKMTGTEWTWKNPQPGVFEWSLQLVQGEPTSHLFKVEIAPAPMKPSLKKEIRTKLQRRQTEIKHLYENRSEMLAQLGQPSALPKKEVYTYAEVSWDEISGAKNYILEIYRDSQAKELELSRRLKSTTFEWNSAPVGIHYYRISYVDKYHRQSPFSDLAKLIIEEDKFKSKSQFYKLDLLYPGHKYISFNDKQGFEWKSLTKATHYKIIVSHFKTKEIYTVEKTISPYIFVKLPTGLYRWKVVAYNSQKEIATSDERFFKMVGERSKKDLRIPKKNPFLDSFTQLDLLVGSVSADSAIKGSSSTVSTADSISLFPKSFRLNNGIDLSYDHFITSSLSYESGAVSSVHFSQLDAGGFWNWTAWADEDLVVYYGPGGKYSAIAFVSDDSSKNLGGNFNYLSAIFQATAISKIQLINHLKQIFRVEGGVSFVTVNSMQGQVSYALRKSKLGLFKNWSSFYQQSYFQVGLEYQFNSLHYGSDRLNIKEWRLPLSLGLNHDWF